MVVILGDGVVFFLGGGSFGPVSALEFEVLYIETRFVVTSPALSAGVGATTAAALAVVLF